MVRIAICDDNEECVSGIETVADQFFKTHCVECVMQTYQSSENLLYDLRDGIGYDLLLLDVTLPDGTGYEVCEQVRAAGNQAPILFLTASDEELNIIRGLDSGGDDYLTKPFRMGELCSRIRALLRRSNTQKEKEPENVLRSGPIQIRLAENRVWKGEELLSLTAMEYRLLCLFLRNKGRVLTREVLLNALWDSGGSFVDDNTLSVHIRRLREKIEEEPSRPVYLLTVRGFGYQWKEDAV